MSKRKTPISKSMPKHFADERYRLACAEPYLWIRKAREVRRAADHLWAQFEEDLRAFSDGQDSLEPFSGDVALMLYGFTVENLLKAGIANQGRAVNANGDFKVNTHSLQGLAIQLSIPLSPEESELLERLETFIRWAGRYPIPLHADALYPRNLVDGSHSVMYGVSSLDKKSIIALLQKIEDALPSEDQALEQYVRNRPTSPTRQ